MTRALFLVGLVSSVFAGCSNSESSGTPRVALGKERGDCKPPAKGDFVGTCDPGLLCLSNLCVRPPPADCQTVADQLASLDLGNYAEMEERQPVVDKYKAICHKAMVSKEQGECIAKATDRFGIAQCAPLMFPELQSNAAKGVTGICATVVEKSRKAMAQSMGNINDPQTKKMLDIAVTVMGESCVEDGWPETLTNCIAMAGEGLDAMSSCNGHMPPDIQQKMTSRMMKAMQNP